MLRYDSVGTSFEVQNLLDGYFMELAESGESRTVNQISEELNINRRTIYRYIRFCNGSREKIKVFGYMMQTLNFKTGNDYYKIQQSYLERLKIERKKKSLMVIKELLARQKIREENNFQKKLK